jgi:hypothetical protein
MELHPYTCNRRLSMNPRRSILLLAVAAITSLLSVGCERNPVSDPEAEMVDAQAVNLDVEAAKVNRMGHDLPFKGSLEGVANFNMTGRAERCRTTALPFVTESAGSGTATHLGRLAWSSAHCTELPTAAPPPYFVFERGVWNFVAANGDELRVEYTGEQIDPLDPMDPQPMALVAHGTITGGTGRFANATGWLELRGEVRVPAGGLEAPDWPLHFDVEGRIRY